MSISPQFEADRRVISSDPGGGGGTAMVTGGGGVGVARPPSSSALTPTPRPPNLVIKHDEDNEERVPKWIF